MNEENQVYFVDSDKLPPAALERKHRLEQDPSFRILKHFYPQLQHLILSRWQEKQRRLPEIILEIQCTFLHRYILQTIARITAFTADLTAIIISGGRS